MIEKCLFNYTIEYYINEILVVRKLGYQFYNDEHAIYFLETYVWHCKKHELVYDVNIVKGSKVLIK
jgi:hypothetical protein